MRILYCHVCKEMSSSYVCNLMLLTFLMQKSNEVRILSIYLLLEEMQSMRGT